MNVENNEAMTNANFLMENFEKWGLTFNARKRFKEYVDELAKDSYYGSKIFALFDEIVLSDDKDNQMMRVIPKGTPLYRARKISVEDYTTEKGLSINHDATGTYTTKGYDESNSIEPPLNPLNPSNVPEGRNNIVGVSYLYVASNPETACAEVKSSLATLVSLAKFETKKEMSIIDFSQDSSFEIEICKDYNMDLRTFFALLMSQFSIPDKNVYHFTQIVSDYLRKFGIDGIAYMSSFTHGTNYTIFNSHKSRIEFKESRILSHQFSNDIFWDFNNQCILENFPDSDKYKYRKETADNILAGLEKTFSSKQ